MINPTPSLFVSSCSKRCPRGVESFLDRQADEYVFYGAGKIALRDGVAGLVEPGQNVLVPAYLPDAVAEPLYDLQLEVRYYALEETLAPNIADLESRLDDETAAICSVNYFGTPQPAIERIQSLADDYGCYHIDDNAHGAFSVDDGTLLGTRGDIGFTSLWKLFPIPNGAVLYLNSENARERYRPSSLATVRERFDTADGRFVLTSMLRELLADRRSVQHTIETLLSRGDEPAVGGPKARYDDAKRPMSKLAMSVLENADPLSIRRRRRGNYRAWQRVFADCDDVTFVLESLPAGICPQVAPVRTDDPEAFRTTLERAGIGGVNGWPRLSSTVRDDPTYETARRLSTEVRTLPVHQQIDPAEIDAIGETLRQ